MKLTDERGTNREEEIVKKNRDSPSHRTGRRIVRAGTADELARLNQAIAEEDTGVEANRRLGRELLAERQRLGEAVAVLRTLRLEAGVTLAEMERRTGMSAANISRLENMDGPNPTIATLDRYAAALGKAIEIHVVGS